MRARRAPAARPIRQRNLFDDGCGPARVFTGGVELANLLVVERVGFPCEGTSHA